MNTVPTTQHAWPCLTSNTRSTRRALSPAIFAQYIRVVPFLCSCGSYLEAFPRLLGHLLNNRLELRQPQEIHVCILLHIVSILALWQGKCVERLVGRCVRSFYGGELGGAAASQRRRIFCTEA